MKPGLYRWLVARRVTEVQSARDQRRTGLTTMLQPRPPLLAWIGAWSGIFGVVAYGLAQTEEMLPINRVLLGIDSTLMMIWLLALLFDRSGRQS